MITYYSKEEFVKVVTDTLVKSALEQKANIHEELSTIYFDKSPDTQYGIRGKSVLRTSYNDNGYFIVPPKERI